MRLLPNPGTFTIKSRGNDTTSVRCAPGSTCATISVSELFPPLSDRTPSRSSGLFTNCRVSLPMMRKLAPCGGASAVISWMRLIRFTRVSISWLTLATAAVVTDVASTSAIKKAPGRTRARSSGRPQACDAA